jgi:exonuclease III
MNSISNYPNQPREHARNKRVIRHITSLNNVSDITCLQETHTASGECHALSTQFGQTHLIFYNNLEKGRAGVITLVNRKFASGYDITQIPLDPCLDGRALILNFKSKLFPGVARASFSCVNLYLSAGNLPALRMLQLNSLEPLLDPGKVLIIGGDFNMVDHYEDRTGSLDNILKGHWLEKWTSFLNNLQLREVHQTSHTHYSLTLDASKSNSARLDRIYTNLLDSEIASLEPQARIHFTSGAEALREFRRLELANHPTRAFTAHILSDHIPVSLFFVSSVPSKKRSFNAPKWIAQAPGFIDSVAAGWTRDDSIDPFNNILNWKKAVTTATASLFRACARRKQDFDAIKSMIANYPDITDLVDLGPDGRYSCTRLEPTFHDLISEGLGDLAEALGKDDALPNSYLPGDGRGEDPASLLKSYLPCTRARLA